MAPEGTRSFLQAFHPTKVTAKSVGDRVDILINGMEMGIFSESLCYVFYSGSRLIQQIAILKTDEKDVAYTYDTGLQMEADADKSPGGNMASTIVY